MTEQPNTAELREEIGTRNHVCVNGALAFDLCDALDSARAEIERLAVLCDSETDRACDEGALAHRLHDQLEAMGNLATDMGARVEDAEMGYKAQSILAREYLARARRAEAIVHNVREDRHQIYLGAEAAEARIFAALAWFADTDCTWTYRVEMARRALTEGTGQ